MRVDVERTRIGVEVTRETDTEVGLLRPGTVIGEIEALLDERIDIRRLPLARLSRECSSMFLTIASARRPC